MESAVNYFPLKRIKMKLIFSVIISICLFGCGKDSSKTIVFGFIPLSDIEEVESITDSLCAHLSKETGLTIKAFVAPDYASLAESMRTRHVQFAWFSPMSFVEAERETKLVPLLTTVRGKKPYFYSGLIVRKDRNINSIGDLKGKAIGLTDPSSTVGRVFFTDPKFKIHGIKPTLFFKDILYLGGHDKVVSAVLENVVDAGATFANDTLNQDNAWHQFIKNQTDRNKIKPLLFSKPIPGDVIVCLEKLKSEHPDQVKLLSEKILELSGTPLGKSLLKRLYHVDALVPANNNDYNTVREVSELVLTE